MFFNNQSLLILTAHRIKFSRTYTHTNKYFYSCDIVLYFFFLDKDT